MRPTTYPSGDGRPHVGGVRCACLVLSLAVAVPAAGRGLEPSPGAKRAGWAATCASEPIRSTGTTYYFCACETGADPDCGAGDDDHAGTSPRAPRRSLTAAIARFDSMSAGDTVAFCKGGRWTGSRQTLVNPACAPGATTSCILRDYTPPWASGDEDRPTFAFAGPADGFRVEGGSVDATDGIRILNLALVHTPLTTRDVSGLYLGPYVSDFEACNDVFDGFYLGIYSEIGAASCASVEAAGGSRRRHFRGNRVLNNSLDGALVDDKDSEYDGNYFDNNGHDAADGYKHITSPSGGASHTFYQGSVCQASNNRFVDNEVHRDAFHEGCVGTEAIWMSTSSADTLIENNLIDMTPGCTNRYIGAIAFGSWSSAKGFARPVIRRNRILLNRGRAIEVSSATYPVIEDNVIVVRGSNWSEEIVAVPRVRESSFGDSSDAVVRNNTIWVENSRGGLTAISAGVPAGTRYTVTGNSITFVNSPGAACFAFGSGTDPVFMDNNHCTGGAAWTVVGGTGRSLGAWRATTGFDKASTTAAPRFVDPGVGDFTPRSGSPLVDAAATANSCTVQGVAKQACSSPVAIQGPATGSPVRAAKRRDAAPDIGAYER